MFLVNNFILRLSGQVSDYIATLPPDTKKQFNRELRKLSQDEGDTHPLINGLAGYHRLRIGSHRVIYYHAPGRIIECVFADHRATVYQTFVPPRTN
jgi:mRNA-degrading endonuclease RelE of RelBE toxin-antitoxin system